MLLFKKKFLAAIRAGEKTQTIRLWKHRRMRAGQRSYIPGIGPIRLTAVEEVDLDGLTDADARPDGFQSAAELRAEIARLYPAATGRRLSGVSSGVRPGAGQWGLIFPCFAGMFESSASGGQTFLSVPKRFENR